MKIFPAVCVLLFTILDFNLALQAEENQKIAILEFQNKAETIINKNRWTMAEDLAKRFKKKNKNVQILSRKEILKQLKELSWSGNRLVKNQEETLASLGARYVVYGDILHWRVRQPWTGGEVQDAAEAMLVFSFDIVDLKTNELVKNFIVEANASGEVGNIRARDPSTIDQDDRYDQETYDATEIALIKAAERLVEILPN